MSTEIAATDDDALDRLIEGMFPTGEGFAAPMKWAEQVKGQLLASDWLAERDARLRAEALRIVVRRWLHRAAETYRITPEGDQ